MPEQSLVKQSEPYDLVIIGGGITGAGIARDAALRGLRVALFEKGDFGSGTSSKSSKLIHGGLRYLEHGEIGMVFESVSERLVQTRVAPHLVKPLPFLVPIFKDSKPGLEVMNLGLWIYDTLALFRSPKLHKTFRGAKAIELEPLIQSEGIKGVIEYYDCITDDGRLVLENILDAIDRGARCESYTEVTGLLRDVGGSVCGVSVRDNLNGTEQTVPCRAVVFAVGAWTDEMAQRLDVKLGRKLLRRTKGVHVVFPRDKLPLKRAVTLISPVDGRVMFAIPWRGRTVIGTTDTYFDASADEVHAEAADAKYLCDSANRYFPSANFRTEDIIATWAGLRPLITDEDAESESEVSREHEIFVRDEGIILIAGGKLTTYRRMAKEVVRTAIKWLEQYRGDQFRKKPKKPRTKKRPLPGAQGLSEPTQEGVSHLARELAETYSLDIETADHLSGIYGVRARTIAAQIEADEAMGLRIAPDLPHVWAEIDFAARHDLSRTLDDVLSRRVPLLLIDRDQGLGIAARASEIVGEILGWDPQRRSAEVAKYAETVAASRAYRQPPAP